jgi:hypothetical protein
MQTANVGTPRLTIFSVCAEYVPQGESVASFVGGVSSYSLDDALRQTVAHIRFYGLGGTLLSATSEVATSDGVTRNNVLAIVAKRLWLNDGGAI